MEQAVEFEPTDSVVFMLNTIANNIAQRNANYLTTLQNVSIGISGFTNRLVNPFSQACFNLFMLFKTFTFESFVFSSSEFLATKAPRQKRSRIEEIMPQAFVMFYVIVRLTWIFSHSGSLVTMSWRSPRNNRKYQLFARFYNEKTLTVPLTNVSKLVRREDHLLNKPPNSMCYESRFQ